MHGVVLGLLKIHKPVHTRHSMESNYGNGFTSTYGNDETFGLGIGGHSSFEENQPSEPATHGSFAAAEPDLSGGGWGMSAADLGLLLAATESPDPEYSVRPVFESY